MSAQVQTPERVLDVDGWDVVERTAAVYAQVADLRFDVPGALGDPEAVRDLIRLLESTAALRTKVRADGGPTHDLLAADPATAKAAASDALEQIRRRLEDERRARKAAKRGTASQRAEARHLAELSRARQDRATALALVSEREELIASLRTQVAELDEALQAESQRVEDVLAQRDSARADLSAPDRLAGHLLAVLERDPQPLQRAASGLFDDPQPALAWFMPLLREIVHPARAQAKEAQRALSVDMLGGGVEVGGSCALVCADDTRILVDVGARPSARTWAQSAPPRLEQALQSGPVDAIVITHAHADHSGWVPAVLAQYPDIPVYATAPTIDLLPTMWTDAARIYQRGTAEQGPAPFTQSDARAAVRSLHALPFGRALQIGDLSVELFPAGHIVGAASVTITDGQHTVVVSGDISGPGQRTVGGYELAPDAMEADLLVLESTYGAAPAMTPRAQVVDDLVKDISLVVSGGGRVLVPAFALGRAQEIAMTVAERLPHVPVLIDGLARDITQLYEGHTGADGSSLTILSDNVRVVPRGRTNTTVDTFTSGVIITTSGMLAGGPVLTWARSVLPDPNSAMMIVGYQDPNSPGGKLLTQAQSTGTFTMQDRDGSDMQVEVNARLSTYQLGAHASSDELVQVATSVRAAATMLVHGDPVAREALAKRLAARHLATVDAGTVWQAQRT